MTYNLFKLIHITVYLLQYSHVSLVSKKITCILQTFGKTWKPIHLHGTASRVFLEQIISGADLADLPVLKGEIPTKN